jgi:hypothetical protein
VLRNLVSFSATVVSTSGDEFGVLYCAQYYSYLPVNGAQWIGPTLPLGQQVTSKFKLDDEATSMMTRIYQTQVSILNLPQCDAPGTQGSGIPAGIGDRLWKVQTLPA